MTDEPEEGEEESAETEEETQDSMRSLMAGGMEIQVGSGGGEEDEDVSPELPDELPVLPLKNTVLFPFLLSPLLVNTPASQELIDSVLLRSDRLLVCSAIQREIEGSAKAADVFEMGTVLRVVKMLKFPDGSYRLLVQGVARVQLDEFVSEDPFLRARIRPAFDEGDFESVEVEALTRNLSQQFNVLVSESARLSDDLQVLVANLDDP